MPKLTHAEAGVLAREELARFIQLLETLEGDDWNQPTYCTQWTVRDILAHQAGAYSGFTSWSEFRRQYVSNPYQKTEKAPIDGINRRQIEDRASKTTSELIEELRKVGPKAIENRQKLPALLRALPVMPMGPPVGNAPIGYLTDDIYPRDTWSHRLDISHATGREMVLTPEHDGRLTALIIQDLARKLPSKLSGQAVVYEIAGPAGGTWQIGKGNPAATLSVKTLDFHLLASGRITAEYAQNQNLVTITGDAELAQIALENTIVLY
ncbi:MAG: maleylpyruvate isomerase family mycothiol-dependent enzyme [Anaerolineae bacterium]|nr:maleylpyruvate isomerase family mycothiol-dependent enzyme [Anaerolineae bacterium]